MLLILTEEIRRQAGCVGCHFGLGLSNFQDRLLVGSRYLFLHPPHSCVYVYGVYANVCVHMCVCKCWLICVTAQGCCPESFWIVLLSILLVEAASLNGTQKLVGKASLAIFAQDIPSLYLPSARITDIYWAVGPNSSPYKQPAPLSCQVISLALWLSLLFLKHKCSNFLDKITSFKTGSHRKERTHSLCEHVP